MTGRHATDPRKGRPGHHDPTAGMAGAAPAQSALTLRLALAAFGLVVCVVGLVIAMGAGADWLALLLGLLAVVAVVDIAVIVRRKRSGEPG